MPDTLRPPNASRDTSEAESTETKAETVLPASSAILNGTPTDIPLRRIATRSKEAFKEIIDLRLSSEPEDSELARPSSSDTHTGKQGSTCPLPSSSRLSPPHERLVSESCLSHVTDHPLSAHDKSDLRQQVSLPSSSLADDDLPQRQRQHDSSISSCLRPYEVPCQDYGSAQDWPDSREAEAMTTASLLFLKK